MRSNFIYLLAALGVATQAQEVINMSPPEPEGKKTDLLVAYIIECDHEKYQNLTAGETTNQLKLVATEECQGDPFNNYQFSMHVWCRPNKQLEFRSYDNINCRGEPTRITKFFNGYCDHKLTSGGFVANWNEEDWLAICEPQEGKTKGEFCRSQEVKEGRKDCLRWSCCSWTDEGSCVANAKKCTDRKKVQSCICPGGAQGISLNPIADIHDGKQDGCSCPKEKSGTCVYKPKGSDDYKPIKRCIKEIHGECGFMMFSGVKADDLDVRTYDPCKKIDNFDNPDDDSGECCTNSICARCDKDKPQLGQCIDSKNRAAVQEMLLDKDFGTQLDLIGCAMSLLNQRNDANMGTTLCNCYTAFKKEDWSGLKNCWINDQETKNTNTQYDACEAYLGISDCVKYKRQSKCNRKHQCVWSVKRGEKEGEKRTKQCIAAVRAEDCPKFKKKSKCNKTKQCVWRHNEGCIADGPYSCEGLKRAKCIKQCGCFFQNPYGCRKNRHRHDLKEKDQKPECN